MKGSIGNNTLRNALVSVSTGVVFVLFAGMLLWLFFLAAFSTAVLDFGEHTYLIRDSALWNVLVVVDFCLAVYCLGKLSFVRRFVERVNSDPAFSDRCRRICLSIIGVLALVFILVTQKTPSADQYNICDVANAWIEKDYSSVLPGGWHGYLEMWPQLLGDVLLLYFAAFLFGTYNYLVVQLFNVACLVFLLKGLAELADLSGRERLCGLLIIVAGSLFLPLTLFTVFVYGNLIGLAFAVNALKHAARYCDDYRTRDAVWAVLLIFAAVVVKGNYLIFLVGLILYALVRLLERPTIRRLSLTLMLTATLLVNANNGFTRWAASLVTGHPMGGGSSSWSWIAMGLQDGGPYKGWYNAYNVNSYIENHFNAERQARQSKEYIAGRLNEFFNDPGLALWFFAGKNASQWNNPSFQGFEWNNRNFSLFRADETTHIHYPRWCAWMFSVPGAAWLTSALNYYQFLILSGVLLFIVLGRRRHDIAFFYCVTFIGGFVFHTFWEAKAMYTLSYFALFLPMFVEGYCDLYHCFADRKVLSRQTKVFYGVAAMALLGVGAIISTRQIPWLNDLVFRDEDTEAYQGNVAAHTYLRLKDGRYRIHPLEDPALCLDSERIRARNRAARVFLSDAPAADGILDLAFSSFDDFAYIRFPSNGKYLDVDRNDPREGLELQAWEGNHSHAQQWKLQGTGVEGEVRLVFGADMALTYDAAERRVYLSRYNFHDRQSRQTWLLERVD